MSKNTNDIEVQDNTKIEKLKIAIDDLQHLNQTKDEIRERLADLTRQSLAYAGTSQNRSITSYQAWLMNVANSSGLGNIQIRDSMAPGVQDVYGKIIFTLTGEGRLDQIAEFLRRFHRTDYLHSKGSTSRIVA